MAKLSYQALNALFDYVNCRTGTVVWMRDGTLSKQLFISESYESVWNQNCDQLYNDPASFNKIVLIDDHKIIDPLMKKRKITAGNVEENVCQYRVISPTGKISFIRDSSYILLDPNEQLLGIAGICQTLTEQEWEQYHIKQKIDELDHQHDYDKKLLSDILSRELRWNAISNKQREINATGVNLDHYNIYALKDEKIVFSKREKECIYYLFIGKSAKQTGDALNISSRTVETYLESIKQKLKCRTKLEILSKIAIEIN